MKPRVFEDRSLTIVVSDDGASVYIGPHELKATKAFNISFEEEKGTSVSLTFPAGDNLKVEQEVRALSGLKWLDIRKT